MDRGPLADEIGLEARGGRVKDFAAAVAMFDVESPMTKGSLPTLVATATSARLERKHPRSSRTCYRRGQEGKTSRVEDPMRVTFSM